MRHAKVSTFSGWALKSMSIYLGTHRVSNNAKDEYKELAKLVTMFTF